MNRVNYQKELDRLIAGLGEKRPSLLLHSCCAPCSSYVLEYLSQYFNITIYYYNPNIYPEEEYQKRVAEQQRLVEQMGLGDMVSFLAGEFDPRQFYEAVRGLENEPECGSRCHKCYELRLRSAGEKARESGFDYFTTTLSISPLKDAAKLNEIGEQLAREITVPYLVSDFKKKNGYQRSTQLSKEYGLYRQNYCGCIFSKREMEAREQP